MDEQDSSRYNNSNRAFLQAFLARSTLTFDEAKPILAAIFTAHERRKVLPKDVTEVDFNKYILAANEAISAFDLEIRSTEHQISRKRTYALVNSTDDPITQLATSYTADEISYVKRVLDAMFETNNTPRKAIMAVSSTEAVRLAKAPSDSSRQTQNGSATQGSNGQSLTMVQAEKTLKNLVAEGWLELSDKSYYSLSPRALMELRGWLIDTYNDDDGDEDEGDVRIRTCMACKEIITVGQRCPNMACACRLHDICIEKFFRIRKATSCPLCQMDWTNNKNFVGERVVTSMVAGKKRSGMGTSAKKNRSVAVEATEEEEDQEGDVQES
ncbi:hypothetical protein MMC29_003748 [Sticta canariensis]|nr:hypothetical protein [Sticta canariensis]